MLHIIILQLEKSDKTATSCFFLHYLLSQLLEKQEMILTESQSVQESQLNDDELKGLSWLTHTTIDILQILY